VSALISCGHHGEAGVYMVARSNALFILAPAMALVAGSAQPLPFGRQVSDWSKTTSSACWPTRRSASSGTCSWHVGWGRSAQESSSNDARLLQGSALPGSGERDSRFERRAGYAQDGRPLEPNPTTAKPCLWLRWPSAVRLFSRDSSARTKSFGKPFHPYGAHCLVRRFVTAASRPFTCSGFSL